MKALVVLLFLLSGCGHERLCLPLDATRADGSCDPNYQPRPTATPGSAQ